MKSKRVEAAMRAVDRGHYSTDPDQAYCDRPHGIGCCTLPCACRVSCRVRHSLARVCVCVSSANHLRAAHARDVSRAAAGPRRPRVLQALLSQVSSSATQTHSRKFLAAGPRCSTSDRGAATSRRASATWSATRAKSSASTGTTRHTMLFRACRVVPRLTCGVWHA